MIVPVAVEAILIKMVRPISSSDRNPAAPKRKLIVEDDTDLEDVVPLKKMIKASTKPPMVPTSTPKTLAVQERIKTTVESAKHSDDESLSLEDILLSLPDDALPPLSHLPSH
ncbi:hypothetical protein F511_30603 [Dorcoceras hygrometricum]|uniref:Uncharacterized protein n=1 Tax=Dorcoceras hygrometricum TaxID=472368 RepID=A0A2Z7BXL7_9LAMI|nr:hypothetical protein F511_30603 [Dorcoceras hygrometricum]